MGRHKKVQTDEEVSDRLDAIDPAWRSVPLYDKKELDWVNGWFCVAITVPLLDRPILSTAYWPIAQVKKEAVIDFLGVAVYTRHFGDWEYLAMRRGQSYKFPLVNGAYAKPIHRISKKYPRPKIPGKEIRYFLGRWQVWTGHCWHALSPEEVSCSA